jgi:hypothetical protein
VGLVEGLVSRIKAELGGSPVVIATGGLAELVVSATEVMDFVDPGLTLKGLRLIYGLNAAARGDGVPGGDGSLLSDRPQATIRDAGD